MPWVRNESQKLNDLFTLQLPYSFFLSDAGELLSNPNATISALAAGLYSFVAAAYSNEAPFLENTGTGQTFLSSTVINTTDPEIDLLGWLFEEKVSDEVYLERVPKLSSELLSFLNPNLFGPVAAAGATAHFCQQQFVTSETQFLCEAFELNSPTAIINDITFPMEWCHSVEDDIVPYLLSVLTLPNKPNIQQYQPPYPFLAPQGTHGEGFLFCVATINGFLDGSSIVQNTPILTDTDGGSCPGSATMEPTAAPSMSKPSFQHGWLLFAGFALFSWTMAGP